MTKDIIKCTIAELVGYLSATPKGASYTISNGKISVSYESQTFQLFDYENNGYRMLYFNGYISGNSIIVCVDANNTILKKVENNAGGITNDVSIAVPDGCTRILYFCIKDYAEKFSLRAFSSVEYDVTQYITDFESLEIDMKRDGTSGAISEVSFPISLADAGRDFAKDLFDRRGLYAGAVFFVYRRGDYDNEYSLLKQIELDFSTYKEYEDKVTIEAAKTDLSEIINSAGKTKYDIPVSDIMDEKQWKNEGMKISNYGDYELAFDTPVNIPRADNKISYSICLPLSKNSSYLVPGMDADFKDESGRAEGSDYFFQNNTGDMMILSMRMSVSVKCILKFRAYYHDNDAQNDYKLMSASLVVRKFKSEKDYEDIAIPIATMPKLLSQTSDGSSYISDVEFDNYLDVIFSPTIKSGEKVGFYLKIESIRYFHIISGSVQYVDSGSGGKFFALFLSKNPTPVRINVINPVSLMQAFLDRMSGQKGLFRANIDWEDEPALVRIVASESIRNLNNANIHGSPNDFFDWMKVLGYEYEVDGLSLNFKRRDKLFQKDNIALRMREDEIADLIIQADSTYAYTSVEIGYEKQDYEVVSGKCEANGTFSYTTQYITRDDNKLSLISPYRADSFGIEKLRNDVLGDTSDKESDNDIFFVGLVEKDGYYSVFDDVVARDNDGMADELYNACYNPYYLVQRNMSLIGINVDKLIFQSTDMSRTSYLYDKKSKDMINMYASRTIDERLFNPIEYNFAAGSWKDLPTSSVRNGLIQFAWKGETMQGFIKEIRKNYATESETTWILHALKK